ncbi:MAG: 5-oxoprolinase subunit PxpA [Thermoanaerobaculia bacterium]
MTDRRDRVPRLEISCDLGEARDAAEAETEAELWALVDAANVACGGHTGDDVSMHAAAARARELDVILGAHPSYPDPEGFGRRSISIPDEELAASLRRQVSRLRAIAATEGVRLARVKPHGALYNDAHHNAHLARLVAAVVADIDGGIALVASPGSELLAAAERAGLSFIREAFGDRRYRADGSLVARSEAGALLLDADDAAAQALQLARNGDVMTATGLRIPIAFDTLCVHGDMPDAGRRLRRIREALGIG